VVVVVLFRIPAAPMTSGIYQPVTNIEVISNVLLIQNIVGVRSLCSPMWSLPFEIQMYMVLPLAFRMASLRRAVAWLSALIVAFSMLVLIVQHATGVSSILEYVPCFLCGVLAYRLRHLRPFLPSALWPFFVMLWMALRGRGIIHDLSSGPMRGPVSAWIATVLLGVSIYCFHDSTNRFWNAAMAMIARYSYGIYLGHVPVMWLVFYVLPVHNLIVSTLLWLAGTAAAAVVAYHLLEEPMINAGRAISTRLLPKPRLYPVPAGES
jgi:peptidoglycan/LPS O-acetylase OafA/YrhL